MPVLRTLAAVGAAAALLSGTTTTGVSAAPLSAGASRSDVSGAAVAGRLLVGFTTDTPPSDQDDLLRRAGARHSSEVPALNVRVVDVPPAAEEVVSRALLRSDRVRFVERDGVATGAAVPNDSYWPQQWGPVKTGTPAAWDVTTGSPTVTLAVLDTGVDMRHPDLAGRLTAGHDFINNDSDATDDHGHGTKTAGILGAHSNNGSGVAGLCWTCSVMPVKVLNSSNFGSWSAISNGIVWATDRGAKIINMSLSGTAGSSTLRSAVKYAFDRGVLVVAAAGNDGSTATTYPASYPEVLSVAGTDGSDLFYSWSQRGSWISLAAPGCSYTTTRGGGFGNFCGTSAAAPHVAGLAGLMLAANPSLTRAALVSVLQRTAVPVAPLLHGRVDAAAAVRASASETSGPAVDGDAPGGTPSTSTQSSSWSDGLTSKQRSRVYSLTASTGPLSAELISGRAAALQLRLLDSTGTALAAASGASPVRLERDVAAGTYLLEVSGDPKTPFTLTVQHR